WLPLAVLWLEQAAQRRSLVRATWAGAAFSLIILGSYPYVTLYAGLFIALWTFGKAAEVAGCFGGSSPTSRGCKLSVFGRWAAFGGWTALSGVALAAVQLLPSLEAASQATRSLGVAPSLEMFLG